MFILEQDPWTVKMKILTVAFMLLFNYLDTLPKLYYLCLSSLTFDCTYFDVNTL